MIKTITKQDVQVSDSCNDCGSFVDIGTVIDEQDTQLILQVEGETALADAQAIIEKAETRFDSVNTRFDETDNHITVFIEFEFTAEKMIFQLENSL
ncbi:DUF406 family protein [Shewanella sp. 1_MG-2023]|jgi:uncharacterized protein YfcZ (UPF0381/DUF406 family)|uniref:YfcZ/YiiS family protein n=1 Tax=Shewanella electrodiphila TaxID=934143 RepID=A0ABT0KTU6_9GAMM|nr:MULTISPECIES: DUF406 family protein [Shewanella]MCC4831726.1 YfcZ/YiiS family protein [Shewanella sp. 10N.7]MCL1046775.1 YfcZ/YiiS family protein [Shewanella electrodiphila]MDO6612924.1 DUF406 family protein [Shewanella sp. 7_MG-2023]MDO6772546.1 DUF406 family protein [Shewanella sp. 2_MG-2023]MDO6795250.1 DUF406 family protein [Shewanella sp. 1_MG-2023]